MRTIEVPVFKFEEFSEYTQNQIKDRFRELNYEWWDSVVEDAADIAEKFGLDIRNTKKVHMDKSFHYDPTIYFSGFWNQGDGACFEGRYSYQKGAVKAVKEYAPLDVELHRIVEELQELQKKNFYRVFCSIKRTGRYNHSHNMSIDCENSYDNREVIGEADFKQSLRDFADWIYDKLRSEYEYRTSDEVILEQICDYEFYNDGSTV